MFATLQWLIVLLIAAGAFVGALWALIDAMRYSTQTYTAAGKNKAVWGAILGAAAAIAFVSIPVPGGVGGGGIPFLAIIAIGAVIFYFVDVRGKLRENRPPSGGGRGTANRGGW